MEKSIATTFENIGLRSNKYVAQHILLENTYNSNLVPDIANVDYLANNNGRTDLFPLPGLPTFVDDLYVYGYLDTKECVCHRGKTICTSGENGSAKIVVSRISSSLADLVDGKFVHTNISHTISANTPVDSSTIRSTIARIEKETDSVSKKNWERQHPNSSVFALFVAKLDVSEIPIEKLHEILPAFEERLVAIGYGIYSIDYTRDFSGTLDRQKLVDYLVEEHDFRKQGTFVQAIGQDEPTILENTNSVGKHVCTWISTQNGYTMRTKIYNKIVSNFEAGEIREQFGGHLADYVDCPNEHLRQTFLHPNVQARGCTRIEVSLYANTNRTTQTANEIVDGVLQLVSPVEDPLFVEQPAVRQWENFATALDRCFVLADRPEGTIYVCWYAHTRTKRMAGIRIHPTKNTVDNDKLWKNTIRWAMGDYGFRNCPIFHAEILSADKENGILLSDLQCYTKDNESKTILAACRRPMQIHKDTQDPSILLPPTKTIEWEWRTKKGHTIGTELSKYTLQEIPEIAQQRTISLLSTRNREEKLLQIAEEQYGEEWRFRTMETMEEYHKQHIENIQRRKEELVELRGILAKAKIYKGMSRNMLQIVQDALSKSTFHICTLSGNTIWNVLGYRLQNDKYRVVVQSEEDWKEPICIWANKGLEKILLATKKSTENKPDTYQRELYWYPRAKSVENGQKTNVFPLHIRVQPARRFVVQKEEKTIEWHPIDVVATPDPTDLPSLQEIALLAAEYKQKKEESTSTTLCEVYAPPTKQWRKTIDLPSGQYICRKVAQSQYRGKNKTILFLVPTDDLGQPTTDEEYPASGHFLEKEVERIGGIFALHKTKQPMFCNIGIEKTTPQKKKDKLFYIAATIEKTT